MEFTDLQKSGVLAGKVLLDRLVAAQSGWSLSEVAPLELTGDVLVFDDKVYVSFSEVGSFPFRGWTDGESVWETLSELLDAID